MKKVIIKPGCISCGACQVVCPEVFKVTDVANIKEDVDFEEYLDKIEEATQVCPVEVIEIEY